MGPTFLTMGFLLKTFSIPDSILQARLIIGRFDHYNTQMTFSTRVDISHRKHLLDSAVDKSSNCVFYSQHKTPQKVFAQTMAADKMLKHSHGASQNMYGLTYLGFTGWHQIVTQWHAHIQPTTYIFQSRT
uniref:Uncharacterized protein n=1 Tax=Gossypium raimondii TaxID=29730 RepID=A0A0D2S1F6_GOSRA|nr:hypothetical protein B456_006G239200 [Gossypium raimondii]